LLHRLLMLLWWPRPLQAVPNPRNKPEPINGKYTHEHP
jgi:hypothetical protein